MLSDSRTALSKPPAHTAEPRRALLSAMVLATSSGPRVPDGVEMERPPPSLGERFPVMRFWTIVASDRLTIQRPPPSAWEVLSLMTLSTMVGVPAANSDMPPPQKLLFWLTWLPATRAPAAPPRAMPPPAPPDQPCASRLPVMTLSRMAGEPKE